MDKKQLDEIRARAEAVTPTPWNFYASFIFITHARKDIPDLLAYMEELEEALEKAFLRVKELEEDLKDILDNTPDTESFAKAYRALSSNTVLD